MVIDLRIEDFKYVITE